LILSFDADSFVATTVYSPRDGTDLESVELAFVETFPEATRGVVSIRLDPAAVRSLLVRRAVRVRWDEPSCFASYPINILERAKAGLPSVLGARPDEQQLLAYFHGRIGEDDLLSLLEQRARALVDGSETTNVEGPPEDLQNYLIREFVESLYGLEDTLKAALYSPRSFEIALLGEFSPAALAERVLTALRAGRRSAMASAFQFAELVRVTAGLPIATSEADQKALTEVQQRGVDRLLGFVTQGSQVSSFAGALRDPHFAAYVRASLPRDCASRFLVLAAAGKTQSSSADMAEEAIYESAS
jgi:hypothetical protein